MLTHASKWKSAKGILYVALCINENLLFKDKKPWGQRWGGWAAQKEPADDDSIGEPARLSVMWDLAG